MFARGYYSVSPAFIDRQFMGAPRERTPAETSTDTYVEWGYVAWKSWLLGRFVVKFNRAKRLGIARKFEFEPPEVPEAKLHSHPKAAKLRSDSSLFMTALSKRLNARRYDVSVAERELKRGVEGSRYIRSPKDLLYDPVYGKVGLGDMVTMVDTDCHMSLRDISRYNRRDLCLYTLIPSALSGHGPESRWEFTDPDTVEETVQGGAVYTQRIWDWSQDMYVLSRFSWRAGFVTTVYDPVVYPRGHDRAVVLLLKARTYRMPLWLLNLFVPGISKHVPKRMGVVKTGQYLVGSFGKPGKQIISIKPLVKGVDGVNVSVNDYNALDVASRMKCPDVKSTDRNITPEGVMRYLGKDRRDTSEYYVLSDYFSKSKVVQPPPINYQSTEGPAPLEDVVGNSMPICPSPVGPGYGAAASVNNMARAFDKRLSSIANETGFTDEMATYAKEFVACVVGGNAGKLIPMSYDEVCLQQNRPTQRARRKEELQYLPDPELVSKAFEKKETNATPGDPRPINQVTQSHTMALSRFTLAAKGLLKRNISRWYCPGKTPVEIATALRGLLKACGRVVGGDYSRMDGRTSAAYREHVVNAILRSLVRPEDSAELNRLLTSELSCKVKGKGQFFQTKGANLSGSPLTTDCNTWNSAFNEFAARRRAGATPTVAYSKLGLYLGDDSVFEEALFAHVSSIAAENGMKMTREEEPEGSPAGRVVFLSRVYPDITTCLHSYPCFVRALRKLTTITVGRVTNQKEIAFRRAVKAASCDLVNGHVPVLGPLARHLGKCESNVFSKGELTAQAAKLIDAETAYSWARAKNARKVVLTGEEFNLFLNSIARDVGLPVESIKRLDEAMRLVKRDEDLLSLKLEGFESRELPEWAHWVPMPTVQSGGQAPPIVKPTLNSLPRLNGGTQARKARQEEASTGEGASTSEAGGGKRVRWKGV